MEFLYDIGSFGLKLFFVSLAVGALLLLLFSMVRRSRDGDLGHILVQDLSHHYRAMSMTLQRAVLDKKQWKAHQKGIKLVAKGTDEAGAERVFVIDFQGDIAATAVSDLRELVSAILPVANERDEVVLRLHSGGGMVHTYGLAAAQLARLSDANIPLVVCVDKIATSGGYMMACVASKIIAAPFAVLGSVGVMSMIPNLHRLLKKYDIDYLEMTAGEYKRTISHLGEITDKGMTKYQEELEQTHDLFKEHVTHYRPGLEIEKIATGEAWYGTQALELNLVDELATSDEYLLNRMKDAHLYQVVYEAPKSVKEKFASALSEAADNILLRWLTRLWRADKTKI